MNDTTWQRLFGFRHAFDHPVTVVVTLTAVVLLVLTPLLIFITTRAAKSTAEKRKALWDRYRSWLWLVLCVLLLIFAVALYSDSDSGRRFLDDSGRGHAESALLSGVCAHHRPLPRTHHQFHRGYRHSPDHVRRTGQLVPPVCRVVSLNRRVDRYWRVDS